MRSLPQRNHLYARDAGGTTAEERSEQDLLEEGTSVVRRERGHQEMREGRSAERNVGALLDAATGHRLLGNRDHHLVFQLLRTPMQSLWLQGEVEEVVVLLGC